MSNRRTILMAAALATVSVMFAVPALKRRTTAAHQRAVIRELESWAAEHSQIDNRDDAIRAAGMIDYISTYYVPSDGYGSDEKTEQELFLARERALTRIADALSAFTGTVMADPLDWPAELCDNTRTQSDGD